MKCPQCVEEGRKSTIKLGVGMKTAMRCAPFYDEEGVYHRHDANRRTSNWKCSNGHKGTTTLVHKCPGCDWTSGKGEVQVQTTRKQTTRKCGTCPMTISLIRQRMSTPYCQQCGLPVERP